MKNILISCAGKRVSLVKQFQHELKSIFPDSMVFTSEMNPTMSPAAIISDGCFLISAVTSDNYITELLNICIDNSIKIIIPTIDTELIILSLNKDLFMQHGIIILVSDIEFISICRDKRKSNVYFEEKEIKIPNVIDKNNPTFPLFAKPFDGSLSKDIFLIKSKEELTFEILQHPKLMFMEYIDKNQYKEFTVDLYYGKDNKVKSIVPRERVEIRAGEISKGYTRKNYIVNYLIERIGCLPGVIGCICMQLFYREKDNDVIGIEINPRFGGGYPLSYHANANFPSYIIREYLEHKMIDYSDSWFDNTLMLRYDSEIIVHEEK